MGSPFWQGFDRSREDRRRSRLDLLNEEFMRGRMSMQDAASRRADMLAKERTENARLLRERMGALDRMKVLERDTAPFQGLLGKYPESGAAADVTEAHRLNDLLARDPASSGRPAMEDPAMLPGAEGPRVPTNTEKREGAITGAYDKFGGAKAAQQKALDALKTRLAGMKGGSPFTRDLDIKLRAVEAKKKQAQALIAGQQLMPNGMVVDIMDPGARAKAKAQGTAMLRQAHMEEIQLNRSYGARTGLASPDMGPAAVAAQLSEQGMDADQIAEQLETMFSPEELGLSGQE